MFIDLEVRTAFIVHGFDNYNQEIVENLNEKSFTRKLILINRIQSISDQYLLVNSSHGRVVYWEYNATLDEVKALLQGNTLVSGSL